MAKKVVVSLINFYQKTLSPDHGLMRYFFPNGACRFYPTCSNYTREAVEQYGAFKGLMLGLARVSRCHRWNPGGFDPVPKPKHD
jgi:putative membrane protein insertion efficiency factor